jgi:hypothetical protein
MRYELEILFPGDAMDQEPLLYSMRNEMPEPARYACGEFYQTREPSPTPDWKNLKDFQHQVFETVTNHVWKKIRIVHDGVIWSAWQHQGTRLVFI